MGGTVIGRAGARFDPRPGTGFRGPRASPAAFGIAVALHAAVVVALLSFEPTRAALLSAPVLVEFIAPPEVKPPPPPKPPERPRPKPVAKAPPKQTEPLAILTLPVEAPSAVVVAPQPAPPPAPPPADAVAVAVPERVALPVTQPIFNAGYLDNPSPSYPSVSRRNGEQGRVILRVRVSPEGRAEEVEIRTSCGFSRLDQAARDTVTRWKFVPAKRGDQAIAAWVLIPISFKLEG